MFIYGVPPKTLSPHPPPHAALRAFSAAAARESFRDAASDLGVTPSAVSHQVRALEEWVGAPLFERSVRSVRLTPLGRALHTRLAAAFGEVDSALRAARQDARDTVLRVSALSLFTNAWMAPRLAGFSARHPDLSLVIDTDNRVLDFARDPVDVAIRNAPAPAGEGLLARKLIDLHAVPICTPALAAKLRVPADLSKMVLIEISARRGGWSTWLKAAGLEGLRPRARLSFDTITVALEAAARGQGVMLGLEPFVWDAPAAAGLVAPFTAPRLSAGAFFVVHRRADRARPAVAAFVDWLASEMKADNARLQRQARLRRGAAVKAS